MILIDSIHLPNQIGCHCVVWFQRSYSCQEDIDETEVIFNSAIMTVELENPQHRTDFNFELRVTQCKAWHVAATSLELSPFTTRVEKSQSVVRSEISKLWNMSHSTLAFFLTQSSFTIFSNHRYFNLIMKPIKAQLLILNTLIGLRFCMNDHNVPYIELWNYDESQYSCHCIKLHLRQQNKCALQNGAKRHPKTVISNCHIGF